MKILQVGKFYAPSLGGIETVVRTLSEGLVEKGTDVTVLCFSTQVKQITEDHLSGVRVLRVPTPLTLFSQPLSRHFIPTLLKEAEKHDVLHFHVPNPLAELGSLFLPEAPRYVATFHAEVQRQKLLKPL
ncbi:MAG: glycosyltransferase [Bdellovibrio sp.]|nr:glycosyltransferase [Bdellovibrio sp.]